jgi:hypothetical protein
MHPEVFKESMELEWLELADNSITGIHPQHFEVTSI